ncbi:hypothetical protein [Mechercharimyces sp. CAU 1602]|uniref:hypothetical protein n=1 Tax=Mechercharimyces sp. CAU 1602 TaxID=2973933 RepID=UPI00216395D4|nr:hypothetical protein [Mechercharimyces sp. CAU 1602]MCS1352799.1 hypothetical protein [Mechercharimyces sp. CAU 1602]
MYIWKILGKAIPSINMQSAPRVEEWGKDEWSKTQLRFVLKNGSDIQVTEGLQQSVYDQWKDKRGYIEWGDVKIKRDEIKYPEIELED